MHIIKFLKQYQAELILALAVILISVTAFNMGKMSVLKQQKATLTITGPGTAADSRKTVDSGNNENQAPLNAGPVIASKNSTSKVYHFPWCASGSKISEKNKITFTDEAAAISAGYTLAGNCQK